jgi:hypothetical protein
MSVWDLLQSKLPASMKQALGAGSAVAQSIFPGLQSLGGGLPFAVQAPLSLTANALHAANLRNPPATPASTTPPTSNYHPSAAPSKPSPIPNPGTGGNPVDPGMTGQDAYSQYQKMVAQFNPAQMANEQFSPQFAMLDRLNSDAQNRYNTNNGVMGSMYDSLQNSIKGDATGISANYDSAANQLASNYASTQKEVAGYQNDSKAQTADLLQRLGIQAAAPDIYAKTDKANNVWNDLMASSNQASTTANSQNKSAALNYNNSIGEQAGFTGKAQQAGLMTQLQDFLNQNAVKRLGLQSDKSAAQSGYQGKLMDMYKGLADSQMSASSNAYKLQMDQAAADLNAAKLQETVNQNQKTNALAQDKNAQAQMTPYDKLAKAASGYGNIWGGQSNTSGMARVVADQWSGNGNQAFMDKNKSQSQNGQEFIRQLMAENPHLTAASKSALQSLGQQYFNNMYKK